MLELPTYIDNIYIKLLMNKCLYEVGLSRLFKTILVQFFVVLYKDFGCGASICTLEKSKYYMWPVYVLNYTGRVALTQSMSVHYSQRKNIYFTAKNASTD